MVMGGLPRIASIGAAEINCEGYRCTTAHPNRERSNAHQTLQPQTRVRQAAGVTCTTVPEMRNVEVAAEGDIYVSDKIQLQTES